MVSKNSFFNFKFFKEEYKKYTWILFITILSVAILKFMVPIMEVINDLRYSQSVDISSYLNSQIYFIYKFIVIFFGVLSGASLFSYLHSKKRIDFYHSIPISRGKLFLTKYFLGLSLIIPIMILFQFILYFISIGFGGSETLVNVLKFLGIDILFFTSIYSITVLSSILSGSTLIGLILTGIITNIFSIALFCITSIIESFSFINITGEYELNLLFNPLLSYLNYNISYEKLIIGINLIIIIVSVVLSFYLSKIRKSENSSIISFKPFYIFIKYFITITASIFVGILFGNILSSEIFVYIGIIFGAIISHIIIDNIYYEGLQKAFKKVLGSLIAIIISVILILCVRFDLFNRGKYIPEISQVKNVSSTISFSDGYSLIDDKDIIEDVLNIHKLYVDREDKVDFEKDYRSVIRINYYLINGKFISRTIELDFEDEKTRELIKNIFESQAKKDYPFLYNDSEMNSIDFIKVNENVIYDKNKQIGDLQILDKIRLDIQENSYKNLIQKINCVNISIGGDEYLIRFNESYENTINYLKSKGYAVNY